MSRDSTFDLRPGKAKNVIANRYEIIRPLGRGGMGKVFLVVDRSNGQKLAMKALRNKWQDNDRVIARFAREVQALRGLNHPCITKIYETGRDGDLIFYTMEYVKGRSVHDWLRKRGRLEFGSVVRVLCMVASALEHAHRITIHRDISPDNIMVMADGSVKLLDFGLAKIDDPNQNLTMVGAHMGKMQYNAPEQRISAKDVDHRADIYSLGVVFFEMLTGHRPKPGERLLDECPELPPACEGFWQKAMAEDREARFSNAIEFRRTLLAIYNGEAPPEFQAPPRPAAATQQARVQLPLWRRLSPLQLLRRLLRKA